MKAGTGNSAVKKHEHCSTLHAGVLKKQNGIKTNEGSFSAETPSLDQSCEDVPVIAIMAMKICCLLAQTVTGIQMF